MGKGVMVLTFEEIEANTKLKDCFIQLQNELLTVNDKALITNILDKSGHLIVSCRALKDLIYTALDSNIVVEVQKDPQKRSYSCCGKSKLTFQVFGNILNITINGKNFEEAEPNLYKYLNETLNISLTRTYLPRMFDFKPEPVTRVAKGILDDSNNNDFEEENSNDETD